MVDKAKMRDELKDTLREVLDSVPQDRVDRDKLHQRLQEMITYAIGRVDYYERYRTTYQTIAMGLIAGAFVITSILIRGIGSFSVVGTISVLLAVLTLLFGAVYILWEYSKETSPNYAYRDVADIRSWYYKYYFKDFEQDGNISPPQGSSERERQAERYFEGLKDYVQKWIQHATEPDALLLEDIEQVYILFALQSFKRRFAQRTSNALRWCAMVSSILLVVGVLLIVGAQIISVDDSSKDRGLQFHLSVGVSR